MTDHEKEADIDAEYNRAIRELMANTDPWVKLAAILLDRDAGSAQGGRAEAVAIEKITTVTPDPPPETTIEKPKIVCSVISLPYIPNRKEPPGGVPGRPPFRLQAGRINGRT